MAKQVATPKQTGGGGFSFEDRVGARYARWLLSGGFPFGQKEGHLVKLQFQKRVDGWHLDDLVLTLRHAAGNRHVGLSVKSNTQFTASAAPLEFVEACWEQFLGAKGAVFVRGNDRVGIVTSPLPEPPRSQLRELLHQARHQEHTALAKRLTDNSSDAEGYASKRSRDLFNSFNRPASVPSPNPTSAVDTAELLSHTFVFQFDFGDDPSSDEASEVAACQFLIESGSAEDAQKLWNSLLIC